jgi:BMFP domain-containing protein YqiC
MQTNNRLLDDFARVTSGMLGVATGMRGEVEAVIKSRLQLLLAEMDLVPREEFEVVKAVAATARLEQEALAKRVEALEQMVNTKAAKAPAGKSTGAAKSTGGRAKTTSRGATQKK